MRIQNGGLGFLSIWLLCWSKRGEKLKTWDLQKSQCPCLGWPGAGGEGVWGGIWTSLPVWERTHLDGRGQEENWTGLEGTGGIWLNVSIELFNSFIFHFNYALKQGWRESDAIGTHPTCQSISASPPSVRQTPQSPSSSPGWRCWRSPVDWLWQAARKEMLRASPLY